MKTKIFALGTALLMGGAVMAQNSQEAKLPQKAQDFIGKHYAAAKVVGVEKDNSWEFWDNDDLYEVHLSNGVSIDFDKEGTPTEISTPQGSSVPAEAVPAAITAYVNSNLEGLAIVSWGKDDKHQEIELANGREFEFDSNGKFLREEF